MTHTPTPWVVLRDECHFGTQSDIATSDGIKVAQTCTSFPHLEQDALHIVKCVNAHDDLVAALKTWLEEYIELVNSGDAGFWDPEKEPKVVKTRALLASVQS